MNARLPACAALALAAGFAVAPGCVRGQQGTQVASANDPARAPSAPAKPAATPTTSSTAAAPAKQDEDALLIDGQRRFHANCGRCHQAPHKFPPRMLATIVRHMRVRATITDEDMRVILHYMTQ